MATPPPKIPCSPCTVAVISDGTAVLGLGDIGPAAAMPVMEGKSLLFKRFAGVDAVPICLACTPVFHDDQHGTAIVTLAALRSAARVAGKEIGQLRAVVAGAGASGLAVTTMLLRAGIGDIATSDSKGLIYQGRDGLNPVKAALAARTNRAGLTGSTESALRGADVFIGLSSGSVAESAIASMADGAITDGMKLAAADAIAALVGDDATPAYVIPAQFGPRVAPAVATQAHTDGVARR